MEKVKKSGWKKIVIFMLMFLLAGAITGAGSVGYGVEKDEFLRNMVMVLAGTGIVIFSFLFGEANQRFIYLNYGRYARFAVSFVFCLAASVLLPLLPVAGWPFLIFFVLLGVFSDGVTGVAAGSVCLLLAVNFAGKDYAVFWLYFISGMAGILAFSLLDEDFKVGMPILISLLILMVCLTANIILFANEKLSPAQFLIPAINLFVSGILLLIILKLFSSSVIHRYRDRYMEINDPECPLLVQLKEMSKEEYYQAIHTAYLGDKIAKKLGMDDAAVKACGYYHGIGKLKGENTWENVEAVCREYHFPPKVKKMLKEYVDEKETIVSKETVVVLFADCIVSAILYVFAKNPKADIDYEQLIDAVFENKLNSGELLESEISLAQLRGMKKIFIEEKLYYDFLR